MKLKEAKNIHFIGIGGIGSSSLAQILHAKKKKISGSDQNKTAITENLKLAGIEVEKGHSEDFIKSTHDLVIYSPAIPKDNPELQQAKKLKIKTLTYPQALGEFAQDYYTIAVAGTHGKSTTTAMIAKITQDANIDPTIVIGTKVKQLNNQNYRVGNSKYLVIEACEYKESFLSIHPNLLVITNLEADHLDYFKTEENYIAVFEKLIQNIAKDGIVVINKENKALKKLTRNLKIEVVEWSFDDENKVDIKLQIPGKFNLENAQNAATACQSINVPNSTIKKALKDFSGTWRRMEHKEKRGYDCQFIDDYGHHPTEIKATLRALKETYPEKKILTVFQPHQYSRTKMLFKDFAKSFADTTKVIIPNIYQVRDSEEDIKAVSSQKLVAEINKNTNNAIDGESIEKIAEFIKKNSKNFDIIITMGAGDIPKIYELL